MSTSTTDSIQRSTVLKAAPARVWRALSDSAEFGSWFGVRLEGAFAPGAKVRGRVTHKGYEHVVMEIVIERMEPQELFSWRWHPNAVDPAQDYSAEPMTLVEFRLEQVPEGTKLTVTESGFDQVPLARRAQAFCSNENGWTYQMKAIEQHVA
jgi:uncharacterized protein YndB with AHSA1/START domain